MNYRRKLPQLCCILGVVLSILACGYTNNNVVNNKLATPLATQLQTYRYTEVPASARSDIFEVSVNNINIDLLLTTPPSIDKSPKLAPNATDGANPYRNAKRSFSWGHFDFNDAVSGVELKARKIKSAGEVNDIRVLPSQLEGIAYEIIDKDLANKEITLRILQSNRKLSIEFVDKRYSTIKALPLDALLIFADQTIAQDKASPIKRNAATTYLVKPGGGFNKLKAAKANSVVFTPGKHNIGLWYVPESVTRIQLDGGAYVLGAINSDHVNKGDSKAYQISGRGVLSGELFDFRADKRQNAEGVCTDGNGYSDGCARDGVKPIEAKQNNFLIEGVTLVNIPFYAMHLHYHKDVPEHKRQGTISNIKMLGMWRYNNDGFAVPDNVVIEDCFVAAMDDAFKIYNNNAKVKDCVVWQMDNGAIFQFGWFPKTVNKALIENIHVIHTEWTGLNKNRGLLNFTERPAGSDRTGSINDIVVRNVFMEGPVSRLVYLRNSVYPNQSYANWHMENIHVEQMPDFTRLTAMRNEFGGNGLLNHNALFNAIQDFNSGSGNIHNIRFVDLSIEGTKINDLNYARDGRFSIKVDTKDVVKFK